MIQGPTNILNHTKAQQYVKYGIFVFILGVLGKRMLNPEVLKCHEDLNTLDTYMHNKEKQWIISFTYMWKQNFFLAIWGPGGGGGASIIRLGPSWFTYILYLIIIYIWNLEAIW